MAGALANLVEHLTPHVTCVNETQLPAQGKSDLSLTRFFEVLTLQGQTGGTKQICDTVATAAAESLTSKRAAVFPVVTDVHASGLAYGGRVVRWAAAPNVTRRTSALPCDLQNKLVDDGMDLVFATPTVSQLFSNTLRRLSAGTLLHFLRGCARETSSEWPAFAEEAPLACLRHEGGPATLLLFVASNIVAKTSRGQSLRLVDLQGAPLLMLQSDQVTVFDERRVWFTPEHQPLLRSHPELFCTRQVYDALASTCSTHPFPFAEAASLGAAKMAVAHPMRYKEELVPLAQSEQVFKVGSWLWYFWGLVSPQYQTNTAGLMRDFGGWEVLPVITASGASTCIQLEIAPWVVVLAEFDRSQQKPLRDALLQCGVNLLQPSLAQDTNVYGLMKAVMVATDKSLVQLLDRQSSQGMLDELPARNRLALLEYFSTRRHLSDVVRRLPLFLLSASGGKYSSLNLGTAVCLPENEQQWAPQIAELEIPGIVHLAWPPTLTVKSLYESLGISVCKTEAFLIDQVVPHLIRLAVPNKSLISMKPVLRLLHDFCSAISTTRQNAESQRAVRAVLSQCRVVSPMHGEHRLAAPQCVDPDTEVADAFLKCGTALHEFAPALEWREKWLLELLRSLGMPSTLSVKAISACAEHMDKAAEHAITDAVEWQSCLLLEEMASQLHLFGSESHCSQTRLRLVTLAKAYEKRIVLVLDWRNGGSMDDVRLEVHERASAQKLKHPGMPFTKIKRLSPFAGVAMPSVEHVTWVVAPVVCTTHTHGISLTETTKFEQLAKSASWNAAKLGLICTTQDPTPKDLAQQLQLIAQTVQEVR
jgi:hypothetical protein